MIDMKKFIHIYIYIYIYIYIDRFKLTAIDRKTDRK